MRAALLLLLLTFPASTDATSPPSADGRTIAVDVPAGAEELADPLRNSGWVRWLLSQNEDLEVVVEPDARGDTEIVVRPLPVSDAVKARLAGLPVRLDDGILELDGTPYENHALSLAVRLPRAEKRTWLITGYRTERLAELAGLVLVKEAGARLWGRSNEPFDYLLRETAWLERSGVWQPSEGGRFAVNRDTERDDFSTRDGYYADMKTLAGRHLELRAHSDMAARARGPRARAPAGRRDRRDGKAHPSGSGTADPDGDRARPRRSGPVSGRHRRGGARGRRRRTRRLPSPG